MNEKVIPKIFPLRMPNDLRIVLEIEASKNKLSLNSEIINRLEESFRSKNPNSVNYKLDEIQLLLLKLLDKERESLKQSDTANYKKNELTKRVEDISKRVMETE